MTTNKIINGIDVSECPLYDKNTGCYHTFNGECVKDSCGVYKWLLEYKSLQEENKELKDRNANLRLNLATYDLPEVKKVLTDWRTGELDRKFKKLQKENKNLKYEIDRHKDTICYLNNHDMCLKTLIKYKKALEEIRNYCDEQNLKADYTACYITNRINEVLNDRN